MSARPHIIWSQTGEELLQSNTVHNSTASTVVQYIYMIWKKNPLAHMSDEKDETHVYFLVEDNFNSLEYTH